MASRFSSYQIRVLTVLALVNFVNYVDRQIVFPLFPLLREQFSLSYVQLGMLGTAFSIVHALGALPMGVLADRVSRRKVIGYSIFAWSCATFTSGLAATYRALLTARALVGIGEAAYTPASQAMITAAFPKELRARVQGIFDTGMFIGGAVGLALGAVIGEHYGWRPAFFIVGVPGLLLGLSILTLKEPPRGAKQEYVPVRALLRVPAYVMLLIGGWFITFAGHAYIIWGPDFVHSAKGFGLEQAGLSLGAITVVSGALGVLTGAALSDRLARRFTWGRISIVPIGFLISTPLIFSALHASTRPLVLLFFATGVFFMTWYHGPVTATVHDLIPTRAHATAMGLYFFFVNLLATAVAPLLVGKFAQRYGLPAGMHVALTAQFIGGLCFIVVVALIRRDGLRHPALDQYRAVVPASQLPILNSR